MFEKDMREGGTSVTTLVSVSPHPTEASLVLSALSEGLCEANSHHPQVVMITLNP